MTQVVPAIIPKSIDDLKEKATLVAPFVKTAQIDIMDGKFAPEPSFPFIEGNFEALAENFAREVRLGFELDMMVERPEEYIADWIEFGVGTFIIHFESTERHQKIIDTLRRLDKGVAFAFKPSLDITKIDPFIEQLDFVQCMGNDKIGYHGVELDEKVLNIVSGLRARHRRSIISVDIGVNLETAPKLVEAGVNKLVSGSAIFGSGDAGEAIRKLSIS